MLRVQVLNVFFAESELSSMIANNTELSFEWVRSLQQCVIMRE